MALEASESQPGTFTISGPVTLYETSGLLDQLLAVFSRSQVAEAGHPIQMDLSATGPWDLAGLQLLVSAVHSGRTLGLPVKLVHVPTPCREVAERSGLVRWLDEVSFPASEGESAI